ncbi:hypothetical protein [Neisseria meningitidis]|uniref:hypothetical protein n=1 Tax=Neisseria meningitidis TaxID=487 RepID=UPI003FEF6130
MTLLGIKLKQTQQLNQRLQQSLRVLQMSGIELEREVENWLSDNPLLERKDTDEFSDAGFPITPRPRVKSAETKAKICCPTSSAKKISSNTCTRKCANTPFPTKKPPASTSLSISLTSKVI